MYLIVSGSLQGKYAYVQYMGIVHEYTKKCCSILGRSYVPSTSFIVMIADKLDLNIFSNPGGAFEPFKKSASTICKGSFGVLLS